MLSLPGLYKLRTRENELDDSYTKSEHCITNIRLIDNHSYALSFMLKIGCLHNVLWRIYVRYEVNVYVIFNVDDTA